MITFIKKFFKFIAKVPLWLKIFSSLVLGVIVGLIFKEQVSSLKVLGDMFINMIKMIVVPLIFFSICSSVISMRGKGGAMKIVVTTIILISITTVIASSAGLIFSSYINIGKGSNIDASQFSQSENENTQSGKDSAPANLHNQNKISFGNILLSIIPSNPLKAMVDANYLQIIVFAFILGVAINMSGKYGYKTAEIINDFSEVMYVFTNIVMQFAPIGVFALIAYVIGTYDTSVIAGLAKFVVLVIFCCLFQYLVVYNIFLIFVAKVNPINFMKKIFDAQMFAFSTASSSATIPLSIKVAEDELGISTTTSKFVIPLCATLNMNGGSIYLGISVVFISQILAIDLAFSQYITILVLSCVAAVGMAGIPGVSLIMMSMILTSVGLPAEAIAIILGVDRILDMVRTSLNISGDLMIALIVDKRNGTFNKSIYDMSIKEATQHSHLDDKKSVVEKILNK